LERRIFAWDSIVIVIISQVSYVCNVS
jgi:hypothetical protein